VRSAEFIERLLEPAWTVLRDISDLATFGNAALLSRSFNGAQKLIEDIGEPGRFKSGGQRAVRDGDWKYLQIAGNEYLFDVVNDPRERANLKERYKDVFDRLKNDWVAWNGTMLAERPRPALYSNPGVFLPDHYGVVNPTPSAPTR